VSEGEARYMRAELSVPRDSKSRRDAKTPFLHPLHEREGAPICRYTHGGAGYARG